MGAKGVRVNSITPGFFPAEQNRKLLFNDDGSPTARTQAIWGHTPMGRFGEPQELVGAAVFLASSQGQQLCHRHGYPRGRRISGADDLSRNALDRHASQALSMTSEVLPTGRLPRRARRKLTAASACCSSFPTARAPRRSG